MLVYWSQAHWLGNCGPANTTEEGKVTCLIELSGNPVDKPQGVTKKNRPIRVETKHTQLHSPWSSPQSLWVTSWAVL